MDPCLSPALLQMWFPSRLSPCSQQKKIRKQRFSLYSSNVTCYVMIVSYISLNIILYISVSVISRTVTNIIYQFPSCPFPSPLSLSQKSMTMLKTGRNTGMCGSWHAQATSQKQSRWCRRPGGRASSTTEPVEEKRQGPWVESGSPSSQIEPAVEEGV